MTEIKLPENFNNFLQNRNWNLFNYQKEFLKELEFSDNTQYLISSDTGTGKTITLFLPLLIDILNHKKKKLIYISPLKSIISDLYQNLKKIISELNLKINVSKRTGDESHSLKQMQLKNPVEILLTTPESLALMISRSDSDTIFKSTSYIAIDELNEIVNTKRGDQLALAISQILSQNKKIKLLSCSANIENYNYLSNWLSFNGKTKIIKNKIIKKINLDILFLDKIPNYGHSVDFALEEIYKIIKSCKSLIFVNTRAQSELLFKNLFLNYPDLKIGIYHGSLSKKIRIDTEIKIKENILNSVITTSALEMGIDWENIDKIINIGAPKSVNKILQKTGRSNHKYNKVSEAILIPTNKFEFLECTAIKELIYSKKFDTVFEKKGAKDVLCQHLLLVACHSSFCPEHLYRIIKGTYPYRDLSKRVYIKILNFIHNGGYALQNYHDLKKLKKQKDGRYVIKDNNNKINVLINAGTIIDSFNFKIKTIKGKLLGTVEESFLSSIKEKDIFIFAGLSLVCLKIKNDEILVDLKKHKTDKVPIYWGGSLPLKSNLSDEILNLLNNQNYDFPKEIQQFIKKQKIESGIPSKNKILIEKFPFKQGEYIFIHTFSGRETNQTLANLLIKFLNRKELFTLNYILNDYSFGLFFENRTTLKSSDFKIFFDLNFDHLIRLDTAIARKVFKEVSMISGLIKKNRSTLNFKKNYVNSDIIFDTLRKYEPEHIILKITEEEIQNHLLHSSQIVKFKNMKFTFNNLKKVSEFSRALIMEKEKTKASDPL